MATLDRTQNRLSEMQRRALLHYNTYASPQEQLRRSHDSTPLHSSDYSEPSGNDESTHDERADDARDQWSNSDINDEPALDAQFREGYH